jgi:hypothetical protein
MSKINLKEFNKLVKEYQEAYDKAEFGTLDHALKGNDVALLEKISSMITGVEAEKESSEPAKKKAPVKSKDEVKEDSKKETSEIKETNK